MAIQGKLVLFAIFSATTAATPSAAETITWMTSTNNTAPSYVTNLEVANNALIFLKNNLRDFDHNIVQADTSRSIYEMTHHDGVCSVGMIHTPERDLVMSFSHRPIQYSGYRAIILEGNRKDFAPYLSQDEELDLDSLATNGLLRGAYISARPNFGAIDSFINNTSRKTTLDKIPELLQLLNLVSSGRVDFTFLTGQDIVFDQMTSVTGSKLLALPIKGSPRVIDSYIACSKMPLGIRIIAEIDRLFTDNNKWATFIAPMQIWVAPSDRDAVMKAVAHKPRDN